MVYITAKYENMRKLLMICVATYASLAFGQTFEIPSKKGAFYDIIEWKGMGALLMSRDANGATKQVNLTLVGEQETSIWDQKFIPKTDDFYYLSSENARYVYFLDNLELNNGKVYFSQLNSAGNIKTTSVDYGSAIRKLGSYDYNKLELINVVVTDKALVHHFRFQDKGEKSTREFVVFMTHHNFLTYAVELGAIPDNNLKDERYGQWSYIGFTEDEIYFAARDVVSSKTGWSVKGFSSKGKPLDDRFINAPEGLLPIQNIGFGTTGKYYLKAKSTREVGLLSQINGHFYLLGAQTRGNGAELILFDLVENKWVEKNSLNLNYFIENKYLELGIYPMNEGIGYHLDHNGYNKVSILSFDGKDESAHNDFSERMIANPSSVLHPKKKEEFTVTLPTKILYFNTDQLNKESTVTFELKEK